jgi:DNA polymerase-1
MLPAGHVLINWNSVDQVLPMARLLHPKMNSLDADSIAKTTHKFFIDLTEYKDSLKLISTYGQSFFKYVEDDGMVRTSFDPIKSTGRVSSSNPNMQNIPAKEHLGNRYRHAFIPKNADHVVVDSDFSSQELVFIQMLSNDPVWYKALVEKRDLHSVCAELVFKDRWKKAAEPTCAYYQKAWWDGTSWNNEGKGKYDVRNDKCSCKAHKSLRNGVKSINFGLAYGMTEYKLAGQMQIPVPEAKKLITEYFKTFPLIGRILNYFEWFGITKGYIMTPGPFFRKRWFPEWIHRGLYYMVEEHISNIRRDSQLAAIGRQSKNAPIQGGAADSAKVSLVLIRWYIGDNNLRSLVKLVMQVHDQNTTTCHKDYAETWKSQLHELMLKAAKFSIPSGLLGAETTISPVWTK